MHHKKISIVVPTHNESDGIIDFLSELYNFLTSLSFSFEIIVIDDGSSDDTKNKILSVVEMYKIKLIVLSRNFGKEAAITSGLMHVSGDAAIIMDADFQHPFSAIKDFIEKWNEGYDMVYGIRKDRKNESFIKRLFANSFYNLINNVSKIDIPKNAGDFRLLDKKVVTAINSCKEYDRFMKGLYMWVGYKSIGIEFEVNDRKTGKSSWRLRNLTELAVTGITSFSEAPLRVWSFIGFIISSISFILAMYIIGKTIIVGSDTPGYASIIVAITFFGGIQLISIGILGEYIGKIFREVKNRPNYIISEKIGF